MGADLYIKSIYQKNHDKYRQLFEQSVADRDTVSEYWKETLEDYNKVQAWLQRDSMHDMGFPMTDEVADKRPELNKNEQEAYKLLRLAQERVSKYCKEMYDKGYYRDSYNDNGVMRTLGLSWWRDVGPLCDDEGMLTPEKIQELMNMIVTAKQNFPDADKLREWDVKEEDLEKEEIEYKAYFMKKKENLIKFLQQAVDLDEPIRASL